MKYEVINFHTSYFILRTSSQASVFIEVEVLSAQGTLGVGKS